MLLPIDLSYSLNCISLPFFCLGLYWCFFSLQWSPD